MAMRPAGGSAVRKRALAIQHVGFENLGCFAPVLEQAGYAVSYREVGLHGLDAGEAATADLLIVLGGPIGAYEDGKYPFVGAEAGMLRSRLAARRPTMGVCLGAQLMARALGARVYPGPEKEIGFAPVQLTAEGRASCLAVFAHHPLLHWHGDTFDLPPGATLLASTRICVNQAYALGNYAIAFQFHPEAGAPGFEQWLIGHSCELAGAKKDVAQLRADYARLAPELKPRSEACLRQWLAQLAD